LLGRGALGRGPSHLRRDRRDRRKRAPRGAAGAARSARGAARSRPDPPPRHPRCTARTPSMTNVARRRTAVAFVAGLAASFTLGLAGRAAAQRPAVIRTNATEEVDLAVGENRTLSATDVANYSEGSPGVADVKLTTDGTQFVVAGV